MAIRIGVSISRGAADLVLVEMRKGARSIAGEIHLTHSPETDPVDELRVLLESLSEDQRMGPVFLALSSGVFACDGIWAPPSEKIKRSAIPKIAPTLCEARTAAEKLETLAVDAVEEHSLIHGIAIESDLLERVREVVKSSGLTLSLVTAAPAVLASVLPEEESIELPYGRETVRVEKGKSGRSCRSFPKDAAEAEGGISFTLEGVELQARQIVAFALAVCDLDRVPNALRGASDAPRSFLRRFRRPVVALGVAAALFLLSVGLYFRGETRRYERELEAARRMEASLWKDYLPDETRTQGLLVRSMKDRLLEVGENPTDSTFPSALRFWAEIGKHLPDVEAMGMTLESLDLSPEGGRLEAVVATVPRDPLKNAALLEGKLNESGKMTTRGDYETRGNKIQVRLRMHYREGTR